MFAVQPERLRPVREVEIGDRVQFKMPTYEWATGTVEDVDDLFGVPKYVIRGPDGKEYEVLSGDVKAAKRMKEYRLLGPERPPEFEVGDSVWFKADYEGKGVVLRVDRGGAGNDYYIGSPYGREGDTERWHSQAYWHPDLKQMVVVVDDDHIWA